MAESVSGKLAAVLPYALPVLGGLAGIAVTNLSDQGNPVIGIVLGVVAGRLLAYGLVRLLSDRN